MTVFGRNVQGSTGWSEANVSNATNRMTVSQAKQPVEYCHQIVSGSGLWAARGQRVPPLLSFRFDEAVGKVGRDLAQISVVSG